MEGGHFGGVNMILTYQMPSRARICREPSNDGHRTLLSISRMTVVLLMMVMHYSDS
jgi:hypothetical protein